MANFVDGNLFLVCVCLACNALEDEAGSSAYRGRHHRRQTNCINTWIRLVTPSASSSGTSFHRMDSLWRNLHMPRSCREFTSAADQMDEWHKTFFFHLDAQDAFLHFYPSFYIFLILFPQPAGMANRKHQKTAFIFPCCG